MRLAHICDLHNNPLSRVPESRTDSYHADVKYELDSLFSHLRMDGVSGLLVSGDFFNLKNPALYSPADLTYYKKVFTEGLGGIPLYTIPGNHDLPQSSYANLEKSPYWVFAQLMGCDVSHRVVSLGGGVSLSGLPYVPPKLLLEAAARHNELLEGVGGLKVVLMHPDAMPSNEFNSFFELFSYAQILDAVPNGDIFCFGHIHHSFPVYVRRNPVTGRNQMVSKPFSFGRVVKDYFATSSVESLLHKPMYSLIEIGAGGVDISYREIDYVPFESAFVPDKLNREIERGVGVSTFLEKLRSDFGSAANAFQVSSATDVLSGMNVAGDVREVVEEYVGRYRK